MAAGILPEVGIGDLLAYMIRSPIAGVVSWDMWLWVNDITPTCLTTVESLVEPTWGGYGRATLDRDLWSVPTMSGCCATSMWGTEPIGWTVGGGPAQTVYGYAFVDPSTSILRYIQRFDPADIAPSVVGERLLIWPKMTLTSAECDD